MGGRKVRLINDIVVACCSCYCSFRNVISRMQRFAHEFCSYSTAYDASLRVGRYRDKYLEHQVESINGAFGDNNKMLGLGRWQPGEVGRKH